ncbi:Hypothetical protein A7982_04994 [Minicystis rosea]|nr:Hypothetical protein A7982_04994 [Minicystis rosea]
MRAAKIGTAVVLAVGLWSTAAAADETAKPAKGTITVEPTHIKARPPRPAVAVDVGRVVPRAPLPDLRQPLVERIGKAVDGAPF